MPVADVFLSYARPDAAAAARMARELGKSGRTVWYDSELPAHRAYADVIERELEAAAAVVVLWSRAAVDSQWVRSEANRARELGKLVQARLDGTRLPMRSTRSSARIFPTGSADGRRSMPASVRCWAAMPHGLANRRGGDQAAGKP